MAKIQGIHLEDRLTERDLVEALGISLGSGSQFLSDEGFKKLFAQWVYYNDSKQETK